MRFQPEDENAGPNTRSPEADEDRGGKGDGNAGGSTVRVGAGTAPAILHGTGDLGKGRGPAAGKGKKGEWRRRRHNPGERRGANDADEEQARGVELTRREATRMGTGLAWTGKILRRRFPAYIGRMS